MRRSSDWRCRTFRARTIRCSWMRSYRARSASRTPCSALRASEMVDSIDVRAPAEQTEGTRSQVLRWLKAVGDMVGENEPLIELETDKVTVEVAAPASGVLREIVKHPQEEIEPGGLLGRIEPTGASLNTAGGPIDGSVDRASRDKAAEPAHAAGASTRRRG